MVSFAVFQNFAIPKSHAFKVVLDLGSSFNLISEKKIKEMQLLGGSQLKHKPHDIDGNPLYNYLEHKLQIFTSDSVGRIVDSTDIFLRADIGGFDIILGRPCLKETKPSIY